MKADHQRFVSPLEITKLFQGLSPGNAKHFTGQSEAVGAAYVGRSIYKQHPSTRKERILMDTEQVQSTEVKITNHMINSMRSTKPWIRLLSVLGFIAVAFGVFMGIFMMAGGSLFPQTGGVYPTFFKGIIQILVSLLYIFPAMYLFKYSSAIGSFLHNRREIDMESALLYQKSFWKFVGIVSLILVIVSIIGIIAAIVIPLVMSYWY